MYISNIIIQEIVSDNFTIETLFYFLNHTPLLFRVLHTHIRTNAPILCTLYITAIVQITNAARILRASTTGS